MAETTAPVIVHSLWAMTAISLILMSLRFLCKQRYAKPFAVDDAILAVSWVFLLVYTALTIKSTTHGMGSHMADIAPADFREAVKILYAGEVFAIFAVAISKTSFAVTLLRLATQPWQRWGLWYIIGSINLIMGLCGLFQYIQCSPVSKIWDITVPGTCWDPMVTIRYALFAGSYSAAMDFILAAFPWVLIRNVHMERREKLGVVVAMSLGFLAGIAAAVKTSYLTDIARSVDFTYTSANLLIWAGFETAVTIMGASIPYYRLVFKEVAKRSKQQPSSYMLSGTSAIRSGRSRGSKIPDARTVSTVVAGSGSNHQEWDNRSDKYILDDMKSGGTSPGIRQTTRITVAFHDRDAESQKSATDTYGENRSS